MGYNGRWDKVVFTIRERLCERFSYSHLCYELFLENLRVRFCQHSVGGVASEFQESSVTKSVLVVAECRTITMKWLFFDWRKWKQGESPKCSQWLALLLVEMLVSYFRTDWGFRYRSGEREFLWKISEACSRYVHWAVDTVWLHYLAALCKSSWGMQKVVFAFWLAVRKVHCAQSLLDGFNGS